MNSIKIRIDDPVFYPSMLHAVLDVGSLDITRNVGVSDVGVRIVRGKEVISKEENKEIGVYLVTFRLLKKDSNDITYNYVYYPDIFTNSLVGHLILKSGFGSSFLFKEWGDFYTIIDNSLGVGETMNKIKDSSYDLNEHWSEYINSSNFKWAETCLDILDQLKKTTLLVNSDDLIEYLDLIIKKDYLNYLVKHFGKEHEEFFKERITYKYKDIYLLKDCVFVVRDIDNLLQSLVDKKYKISPEKKVMKNGLTSSSSFLSHLDSDYRHNLYKHHLNKVQHNIIPSANKLSRSKFSFFNVHQKIGNTRLYTTNCKKFILEDNVIKNRQLFKNNYTVNSIYNIYKNILINKYSYQNIHLNLGNVRWYSTKSYKRIVQDNKEVFYDIKEYLKYSPINCDTQLKIETSLYDFSYISLIDKRIKSDKPIINYKLLNKRFSNLLLEEKVKLVDYITRSRDISFKEEPKKTKDYIQYLLSCVLKELKDDYIISVIYGRLFKITSMYDISIDSNKAVDVFVDIGKDLVENYFYNLYIKHKKKLGEGSYKLSDWKKENSNIVTKYDDTSKAEIGGKIIGWLKNLDLIRIQLITKGKKERENVIAPTERVLNVLDKEKKIKPLPRRLPMIVKPINYKRVYTGCEKKEVLGGYLLNDEKYIDPLIIPKWNFGKSTLINDDNLVYDLVNNINSVGFKVNKDVLEFISIYGSRYDLIINSNNTHPLSNKEKLTKYEYKELFSFLSKKALQDHILSIADMYSDIHEFFLPTRLDSRGRLYCISEYLNYQSTELAKALLLFSNGEKMYKYDKDAISYLKAYGANCYGNKLDKMSWKSRCKWVDDNVEKIISFRDGELIEKAEKKLLFIAFCFEYNRFLACIDNEKEYFETYLPIQLDATCNGYQHLSLLSLDHDLAKELNLTKSHWDEEPKDFYNFMAVKLINFFKDKLNKNNISEEEREVYARYSHLTIARKIVKKVIMTIPYNVTYFTIIDYLKSNFTPEENGDIQNKIYYYKEDSTIQLKETDFPIIAKGLKIVLFDDRFKLNKLLTYLNQVVKVVTYLDLPVSWGTPDSGVLIEQSYLKTKEERLKVFSYTKKTFKIKVTNKSEYNKSKQRVSFLPNFIHSLDATALALLVHYYFNDITFNLKNIYTIHDCFAVTANNVKNLTHLLSHVYQKIYTEKNYLRIFDRKMIEFIKYNCNKDIDFNDETLVITTKKGVKLQYPLVVDVLGVNCKTDGLIKESSYLIH